jgi:hypothetical protein
MMMRTTRACLALISLLSAGSALAVSEADLLRPE